MLFPLKATSATSRSADDGQLNQVPEESMTFPSSLSDRAIKCFIAKKFVR